MDQKEKVWLNRLRRKAKRIGHKIRKSRVRIPSVFDMGGYQIETMKGRVVRGRRFDMSLDEVDEQLDELELEWFREFGPHLVPELLAHRVADKAGLAAADRTLKEGATWGDDQYKAAFNEARAWVFKKEMAKYPDTDKGAS